MDPIIRSIRRYLGEYHRFAYGKPVVIVAVHRTVDGEDLIMGDDSEIDGLQPGDLVEWVPILVGDDGKERTSWVTSDASPNELSPPEGTWDGGVETTIILERSGGDHGE